MVSRASRGVTGIETYPTRNAGAIVTHCRTSHCRRQNLVIISVLLAGTNRVIMMRIILAAALRQANGSGYRTPTRAP